MALGVGQEAFSQFSRMARLEQVPVYMTTILCQCYCLSVYGQGKFVECE
jgi:hypothetical protein